MHNPLMKWLAMKAYSNETRMIARACLGNQYTAAEIDRIIEATYEEAQRRPAPNSITVRHMLMDGSYIVPPDVRTAHGDLS